MMKLKLWLARKIAGKHVVPRSVFDAAVKQGATSKLEVEALTQALHKVSTAFHGARQRQADAESALQKMQDGTQVIAPKSVWDLVPRARELTQAIERKVGRGASGEYKRGQVYAQMLKEFPPDGTLKADIGLAIELSLRSHVAP